jgi:glucosamine--fructose-6-phosphate aminotransferase (isomerizing)
MIYQKAAPLVRKRGAKRYRYIFMCGIIGYIGKRDALPVLLDGLKRMEYRGYDSSGVAVLDGAGAISSVRSVGRIASLEARLGSSPLLKGMSGIGHTRWATHGGVTEANAHPHSDCEGNIAVAHNGIVENHRELKEYLLGRGHRFRSETDSEAIAHLIEDSVKHSRKEGFEEACREALGKIRGTYGLVAISVHNPDFLFAARNFSPLLLGIGEGEYFVASDPAAVLAHTRHVIYLEDGEMAVVSRRSHRIWGSDSRLVTRNPFEIEWSPALAEKGGYPHFMLKEIMEEPAALRDSLRGRMVTEEGLVKLGGIEAVEDVLRRAKRLLVMACGTAYFAARVGEYMIEEYAGIPVEVDIASEFRYRKPVFLEGDVVLVISQSGETADTLGALKEARAKGVPTLGIVNVVGSTIARETDAGIYQHAGPEIGVASTKAFLSQVAILSLLTVYLGRMREMSLITGKRILGELEKIPSLVSEILEQRGEIERFAEKYRRFRNFLFLGRKYNLPVAYEGALKLKEISYVHAEGCGAGEIKHGPIAMIDGNFPSFVIAPRDSVYEKSVSNIEEIKARGGPVFAIATKGDGAIASRADGVFFIPKTLEMLTPLLSVIPLQLFAYYFGVISGCDVDKPRNLAKSVTVE